MNEGLIDILIKKNGIYKFALILNLIIVCIIFYVIYFIKNIEDKIENISKPEKNTISIKECKEVINKKNLLIKDKKCYQPIEISKLKIMHLIMTRFQFEIHSNKELTKLLYKKNYIENGIRVMKTYLINSLENQSCKDFTWVLILGSEANLTYIKSFLDEEYPFEFNIIIRKDIKNYINKKSKNIDVFITTRIDYDDRIYYDAVNDIRKAININKPISIHGYNRGLYYFESNGKYYEYYRGKDSKGILGVFISLITILKNMNDTINIYEIGPHTTIKTNLLNKYKSYGIKNINYDPIIIDSGSQKFVYVRQKYSNAYNLTNKIINKLKEQNFDLNIFLGIK